jgi:hypothetical protein
MKIGLSPSQLLAPRASTEVDDWTTSSTQTEPMPPQGIAGPRSKLDDLALTHSDKMDALRPLVSNVNYPPEKLFQAIAHLLAIHLTE